MQKQYILNETEMRKILVHLENSIIPKDDVIEKNYELLRTNHYELLDDIGDILGVDANSELVNPVTLEIEAW